MREGRQPDFDGEEIPGVPKADLRNDVGRRTEAEDSSIYR